MVCIREYAFHNWLTQQLPKKPFTTEKMSGDAGFRQYSRIIVKPSDNDKNKVTYIAVDAPPEKSNNLAFVAISKVLITHGIEAPKVLASDFEQGFFLISDLGNTELSQVLTLETMDEYYRQAIDELIKISTIKQVSNYTLPLYNAEFVQTELDIFTQWLLKEYLQLTLQANEKEKLQQCFNLLIENVQEQPQVFMHRDYHSRNLMLTSQERVAVIDFQDAVLGPITYDIVSLLRDCYIRWPQQQIFPLFEYYIKAISSYFELSHSMEQWQKWFDLMGLQRHIKASGIFARLHLRDNKSTYLQDIPLTLSYIVDVSKKHPNLNFLAEFVSTTVLPALEEKLCEQ